MGAEQIVNSGVWWTVLLVVILFFTGYSAAILYHWFKFAMNKQTIFFAMVSYFFVAALILFIMFAATIALTS